MGYAIRICCLLVILLAQSSVADTVPSLPEKYKDARWHYLKTDNFEILSIDPAVPGEVKEYIEQVKTWTAQRWGMEDIPLNKSCMVICFPSQEMFMDCLKVSSKEPKITKSKNMDGSDRDVYAIWIVADSQGAWLTNSLREHIGRVVLLNYEETHRIKIPAWAHLGMSYLNNDIATVRAGLGSLDPSKSYDIKDVFALQMEGTSQYLAMKPEQQQDIKLKSAACALMVKKEFPRSFDGFLNALASNPDTAVGTLGFSSHSHFGQSYNSYVRNLSYDIRANVTPKSYLTWFVTK